MYDENKIYELRADGKTLWGSGGFMNELISHRIFKYHKQRPRTYSHPGVISVNSSNRGEVSRRLREMSNIQVNEPKFNDITKALKIRYPSI